jgi:hypothetical protein
MYFAVVVALFLILPAISILTTLYFSSGHPLLITAGTWFTFWAVGGRLFLAGIRQTAQPSYTAKEIFQIDAPQAFAIVRELGSANLCMGTLGLVSAIRREWVLPAALVGGLYYGCAALIHIGRKERNVIENFALATDLFAFALLIGFFALTVGRPAA